MITLEQYFAGKPHSSEENMAASDLLSKVNKFLIYVGCPIAICPNTGTQISGSKGGAGDGGFRLQTSTTGAARSSHKEAKAIDVYDPKNELERAITDEHLVMFDLYREASEATPGWVHLTTRAPSSGHRTFIP